MSCLVNYKPRTPLTPQKLRLVKRQIKEIFTYNKVKAVFLFGSCARGDYSPTSDIDLLIIKNSKERFIERPFEFPSLLNLHPNIDVIVYTEQEFEAVKSQAKQGFAKQMLRDLVRLI